MPAWTTGARRETAADRPAAGGRWIASQAGIMPVHEPRYLSEPFSPGSTVLLVLLILLAYLAVLLT